MYLICSTCRYWRTTVQIMKLTFVSICFFVMYYTADTVDCMLPCICSVIDHRRCQNVVRTSAHCASFYHMWFVTYSRQKKLTLARLPRASKFWSWANKIEVQWLSGRVKLDSVVLSEIKCQLVKCQNLKCYMVKN